MRHEQRGRRDSYAVHVADVADHVRRPKQPHREKILRQLRGHLERLGDNGSMVRKRHLVVDHSDCNVRAHRGYFRICHDQARDGIGVPKPAFAPRPFGLRIDAFANTKNERRASLVEELDRLGDRPLAIGRRARHKRDVERGNLSA